MAAAVRGNLSRLDYGQRWGEGAARCFSIESDFDEDESVRLMPIPECFICPMSQTPMEDPVMTVDGCVYERSYIEQWIRHRQQHRMQVTSPATNQVLPSHRLVSLTALKKAIEAYLAHRPELKGSLTASRSFEEAAQMLQSDLLEKQAAHVSAEDEISLLRDSNEVLAGALLEAERLCASARNECKRANERLWSLEKQLLEKDAAISTLTARVQYLDEQCCSLAASCWDFDTPSNFVCNGARHPSPPKEGQQMGAANPACTSSPRGAVRGAVASSFHHDTVGRDADSSSSKSVQKREAVHFFGLIVFALTLTTIFAMWEDFHPFQASLPGTVAVLNVTALTVDPQMSFHNPWASPRRKEELKKDDARIEDRRTEFDQDVGKHISQLRTGTPDQKTDAALVLGILATASSENQAAIVRAGAVPQLVELLKCDMPEARGQAAVALRALAANNTYNKVAIVRAGAIPVLIRLLQQDTAEVQEVAESALQALAETNSQVEIAQAGAIVPLVALLKDVRPGVREEAAGALVILALNADNQVAIAQVGAIPLLVELLHDEAPEVREQAAAALRNLAAENAHNQAEIARAGAFAPLAELLKDNMPGVREEALAALRNLAGSNHLVNELAVTDAAAAAGLAIKASAAATLQMKDVGSGILH